MSIDVAFALDKLAKTGEQAVQVAILIHLQDFSMDVCCQFVRISYRTALAALERSLRAPLSPV